ncbi:MAG: nuclear transport factor 2 family protein [Deltaproteobacteria bacterium]|nr:nuclear transport factor 2 family protein [Deltaproteobacteria bacterium]MDL1987102.1 nuclear transport factor 2 family protein [Deltaproteobacteria bacterium]
MTTREIVTKYFEYVNNGDWEGWLTLFADNAVVIEPVGAVEGIENLRKVVEVLKKGYSKFQNNLINMVVEGNHAVAITHIEAVTASGVPVDAKVANYYTIEDGKIIHQENFLDPIKLKPFLDQQFD